MTRGERFISFVQAERRRHTIRLYLACLLAALITLVLYETQWLYLRPGLLVLLLGQAGDVLALLLRNAQLSKEINLDAASHWFEREETFIRRLALFDAACQMIGFLALGYGFWLFTGSLGLSLAIGIVYPVTMDFGMNRRKTASAIRQLRAQQQSL